MVICVSYCWNKVSDHCKCSVKIIIITNSCTNVMQYVYPVKVKEIWECDCVHLISVIS